MPLLFKPGFIYLIRNRVNGKGYVGQTVKSVRKRFAEHSPEMRRKISEACKGKKKPRRAKG